MEELIKHRMIKGQIQERKRYIEELDRYWLKNKIITQSIIKGVIKKISGDNLYIECNDTEGAFITEKCIYENNTANSIRNIFVKYIKGYIVLQSKAFRNNVVSGVAIHIDGKDLKGILLLETNEKIRLGGLHIINGGEEKIEFYIDNRIDTDFASLHNLKYIRKIVARDYIYIRDNIKTFALSSNKVTIENEKEYNTIVEMIKTRELYIPALKKGNIKISVIENENNGVYIDRYYKESGYNSYDYIKSNILKISKIPENATIKNIPNIKIDKFLGKKIEIYINIKNDNCTDWQDIEEYKEVIRKSFIEIKTSKDKILLDNMYIQDINIIIDCGDSKFKDTMFYYIKNNGSHEQKYNNEMRSLKKLIKEYVKVEAGENCVVTTNIIIKENNGHKIEFAI